MAISPQISFRAPDELVRWLASWRGEEGAHLAAREALLRYHQVLADELARVDLSEAEWNLLRDALNGTWIDETSYRHLWMEIADAIRLDRLDEKWGVDGPALVEKLRGLCPGACMAVAHAVERWWRGVRDRRGDNHSDNHFS